MGSDRQFARQPSYADMRFANNHGRFRSETFAPETLARRSAERAGAKVAVLKGAGHWWMCQQPKQGADAINAFLANLN